MTAVLYIMMRNDLASMNTGKAIAQGSHASNAFVGHFHATMQEMNAMPSTQENLAKTEAANKAFYEWENSTRQSFGTVLVLEANMRNIYTTVDVMKALGYIAGVVHDPTYPIIDGEVVHHIPLDTCAYIFVPNKETDVTASSILKTFPLHR
jgi:peptidyl-tRNA hydrolase